MSLWKCSSDVCSTNAKDLVFQLNHQLHLARVLGLDDSSEGRGVVWTDAQPVGMVQQVGSFHAELQQCAFVGSGSVTDPLANAVMATLHANALQSGLDLLRVDRNDTALLR